MPRSRNERVIYSFPMIEALDVDELVLRAKDGDETAFAGLYDVFAVRVYRFFLARVREPADAEDLVQHVFIKLVESLPRYEQRGIPFGAWIFRVARNMLIDFDRAKRTADPLDAFAALPDGTPGPAAQAEAGMTQTHIRAALDTLTPEQRDVIVYRFFAGLTPGEIGALMGKREGSIRALQFRALEGLRRLGVEALGGVAE